MQCGLAGYGAWAIGQTADWPVPTWPFPPWSAMAICQPAVGGGGKGAKGPAPLTPGRWFMPTVGKAPCSGVLSTGREPHAIPGVALPVAVILTAHRLRSPRHPARQTAWSFGLSETSKSGVQPFRLLQIDKWFN
jgi:hypothetical protein